MDCPYSPEDILVWLYGEMPPEGASAFEEHLAGCETCRETVARFRRTREVLDEAADVELPPKLAGDIDLPRSRRRLRHAAAGLVAVAALLLIMVLMGRDSALGELRIVPQGIELTIFSEQSSLPESYTSANDIQARQAMFQMAGPPRRRMQPRRPPRRWGLALIRDKRNIFNLPEGDSEITFTDVAATIDPETVRFESLTDPEAAVVREQNFEFDLASPQAVLKRYIDRPITLKFRADDMLEGYLASFDRKQLGVTTKAGGEPQIIPRSSIARIQLEKLPEGLVTRPTLRWIIRNTKPGDHETVLSYLAGKMKWRADYVVVVHPGDVLDLKGWVTIVNQSGASYHDAKLKLMAGDVHRVREEPIRVNQPLDGSASEFNMEVAYQFKEKAFFEYHLYTLQRSATLLDNQTKQISLLEAQGVKCKRKYVFDAARDASRVRVSLEFKNEKANRLGMPLPKGRVRIMMNDPDGEQQLHNTDSIDHTPKDEEVELTLGLARGLIGERTQTDRKRLGERSREESYRIRLRNHRDEDVVIVVREHMQAGAEWKFIRKSHEFEKEDANTVRFAVAVPVNMEKVLTYTVRYHW